MILGFPIFEFTEPRNPVLLFAPLSELPFAIENECAEYSLRFGCDYS